MDVSTDLTATDATECKPENAAQISLHDRIRTIGFNVPAFADRHCPDATLLAAFGPVLQRDMRMCPIVTFLRGSGQPGSGYPG